MVSGEVKARGGRTAPAAAIMRTARPGATIGLAVLSALAVTSCSMLPGTKPQAQPAPATSAPPASKAPATPAATTAPSGATPPPSTAPTAAPSQSAEPVIATKTGTDDSGVDGRSKLKLTVNPIVRSGGLSHLTYTITVLSADQQWDADSLGGDMSELGDNIGENYASGTQLVDTTNKKRYVTAYDATDNTCECSLVANVSLQTGDSRQFFNYFANPPASVHSMDVNFPIFGEVDNVPVQ